VSIVNVVVTNQARDQRPTCLWLVPGVILPGVAAPLDERNHQQSRPSRRIATGGDAETSDVVE
jgi:hypothetical protein